MAALGAVEVGAPDGRAVSGHHLGDDTRTPAVADHVDHHLVVLEHPVPTILAIDAHAGLVRADDAGAAETGQNGAGLASKRGFARRKAASGGPSLIARPKKSSSNRRAPREVAW